MDRKEESQLERIMIEPSVPNDSAIATPTQSRWKEWRGALGRSPWVLRSISLLAFAAIWEIGGQRDTTLLLPPFSRVMSALWNIVRDGSLISAFAESLQAFVAGYALSVVVGIWVGLLMARFRVFGRIMNPYLDIILASPTIAFIPLFVIWFGLGMTSRVLVIFSFAVVVIAVNTEAALRAVNPQIIEMGRSFGLGGRRLFFKVGLPAALPLIIAGLRFGAARGFVGMVAADILLVSVGIGGLMQEFNVTFRTAELFATVLGVLILALLVIELLRRIERSVIH